MAASVQDGAFAWLLCVACFFNITLVGGIISTSGIFYIMFRDSLDATDYEVSLITSINIGVMHFVCPFAGLLSDTYGVRCVSMIGAVLSTAGLACGAFSMQIYQLYITYGLIAGTGLGVIFNCSVSIIDSYFDKYKRTACSLVFTGFGVGSFILPPILKSLENAYGWRGAILILAGINAHLVLTSALLRPFKAYSPHAYDDTLKGIIYKDKNSCKQRSELDLDLNIRNQTKLGCLNKILKVVSLFKILTFGSLCAFTILYIFPLSILLTHFGSYALTLGFSNNDVVRLYMAFGISSTISRPITGVVAQVSNANVAAYIMITLLLDGILTLCVPFLTQLWMLYVYAVLFQILITPSNVLASVMVMEHVPKCQVAVAYGLTMLLSVPGYTFGGPLAVWLYDYTNVYAHSFFLAGGLLILAGLAMVPASYHIQKQRHKHILAKTSLAI